MASQEDIDRNKDKLDIRPNIDFVSQHMANYETGLDRLFSLPVTEEGRKFADSVLYQGLDAFVSPQLNLCEMHELLSSMPPSLARLSRLKEIQYYSVVPVPTFDENGEFTGKPDWVDHNEFPRPGDHPSRILVGVSNGTAIYPTPIPKTVSDDKKAIRVYQAHVFLHEFFHTIELPRRDLQARTSIKLECDGDQFTFQDIWNGFKQLYLRHDRTFVSRYSAIYTDSLNMETKNSNPAKFNSALGEQICESFVGYMLGIISNNNNETHFENAHPEQHRLIDMVYRANVIHTD